MRKRLVRRQTGRRVQGLPAQARAAARDRRLRLRAPVRGAAGVHPRGRLRHRPHLPGQERHGQDRGLRALGAAAGGPGRARPRHPRAVPLSRAGLPDRAGVRAAEQVPARGAHSRGLRRRARGAACGAAAARAATGGGGHARARAGAGRARRAGARAAAALRGGRVRQGAGGTGHALHGAADFQAHAAREASAHVQRHHQGRGAQGVPKV